MLLEEDFDALGAVDLADARQLAVRQVPDLDGYLHPASLPREGNCCCHEDAELSRSFGGWRSCCSRRVAAVSASAESAVRRGGKLAVPHRKRLGRINIRRQRLLRDVRIGGPDR
jgi:hypothetical protein